MKRSIKTLLISISLVLMFFTSVNATGMTLFQNEKNTYKINQSNQILSNSPLLINGNKQLQSLASTGSGTSSNPFIIGNLTITVCSAGEFGVSVNNTDLFFILNNITVNSCNYGFYFYNVSNAIVNKSIASNNINDGFYLKDVVNTNITDNNAFDNSNGFEIDNGSRMGLLNNNASGNLKNGLSVVHSAHFSLVLNNAQNNSAKGIDVEYSTNVTIDNNTAIENYIGLNVNYLATGEVNFNFARFNSYNDYGWYAINTITEFGNQFSYTPSKPLNLTDVNGTNSIFLKWDKPNSNGYANITDYAVFQSTDDIAFRKLNTTQSLNYTDYSIKSNITYYYIVYAENRNGQGTGSNIVPAQILVQPSTTNTRTTTATKPLSSHQTNAPWSIAFLFITGPILIAIKKRRK